MAWPKQFTEEEDAQIVAMRKQGYTIGHIAREIGKTQKQVESHWQWLRKREKGRQEQPEKEVAPPWTPEEDELLFDLRAQGLMWKEIAPRLHRSLASCSGRYNWFKRQKREECDEIELEVRGSLSRETPAKLLPKTYWRKCHDCGKMTYNYRCDKCAEKWRNKHGISLDEEGDSQNE